jgi:hypothetical protein
MVSSMRTLTLGPRRRHRRGATLALGLAIAVAGAQLRAPLAFAAPPPAADVTLPAPSDAATDLALAEKYYANMDYVRANAMAARVAAQQLLKHSELVEALRLVALTDAALGKQDQAREDFIEVLTYAPDLQIDPNLGPRVTAPFLEARGFWRAQPERPGMEVAVTVHADGPGTLRVITRDPTGIVKSGKVGFRWGSSVPFAVFPLTVSSDGVVFDVPERPANLARLDYYAQVVDARGAVVMEVGTPTSPKSATVEVPKTAVVVAAAPEKKGGSIFASPFFWTGAAVVVAGAAVATYFLTRPRNPTGATLTGGATCGSTDSTMPAPACR